MRRLDHEVVNAALERIDEIGNANLTNSYMFQRLAGACYDVKACH